MALPKTSATPQQITLPANYIHRRGRAGIDIDRRQHLVLLPQSEEHAGRDEEENEFEFSR